MRVHIYVRLIARYNEARVDIELPFYLCVCKPSSRNLTLPCDYTTGLYILRTARIMDLCRAHALFLRALALWGVEAK